MPNRSQNIIKKSTKSIKTYFCSIWKREHDINYHRQKLEARTKPKNIEREVPRTQKRSKYIDDEDNDLDGFIVNDNKGKTHKY